MSSIFIFSTPTENQEYTLPLERNEDKIKQLTQATLKAFADISGSFKKPDSDSKRKYTRYYQADSPNKRPRPFVLASSSSSSVPQSEIRMPSVLASSSSSLVNSRINPFISKLINKTFPMGRLSTIVKHAFKQIKIYRQIDTIISWEELGFDAKEILATRKKWKQVKDKFIEYKTFNNIINNDDDFILFEKLLKPLLITSSDESSNPPIVFSDRPLVQTRASSSSANSRIKPSISQLINETFSSKRLSIIVKHAFKQVKENENINERISWKELILDRKETKAIISKWKLVKDKFIEYKTFNNIINNENDIIHFENFLKPLLITSSDEGSDSSEIEDVSSDESSDSSEIDEIQISFSKYDSKELINFILPQVKKYQKINISIDWTNWRGEEKASTQDMKWLLIIGKYVSFKKQHNIADKDDIANFDFFLRALISFNGKIIEEPMDFII